MKGATSFVDFRKTMKNTSYIKMANCEASPRTSFINEKVNFS